MCFETCLKSRFNLLTSVANVGAMSCSYTLGLWSRSSTVELVDHLLLELDLDLEAVQNTEHLHTNCYFGIRTWQEHTCQDDRRVQT